MDVIQDIHLALLKEEPCLEENYHETYAYVLPKDPWSAYVIFEIGEATKQSLQQRFGEQFFERNYLIMRVYQIDGRGEFSGFNYNYKFEVDDFLKDKTNYWLKLEPEHNYIVELGYKTYGTTFFEMVARSNPFTMPRAAEQKEQRYSDWRRIELPDPAVEVNVDEGKWRYNFYLYWKHRQINYREEEKGYWMLLLHNHLPFIRHPEYEVFFEEQWLFEAMTSVYTQLLYLFQTLEKDGLDFRLTLSLSPTLMSMLQDPLLQQRYRRHIRELIAFAEKEYSNSENKPFRGAIEQSLQRFFHARRVFDGYDGDLLKGFGYYMNQGKLELITCPATHAILPFYLHYPEVIRTQIRTAIRLFQRIFRRSPQGMWLPENAYHPGLDSFLLSEGINWTVVNTHAFRQGDTRSFYDIQAPVITNAGLCIFGIDDKTKGQVWSKTTGYPGDPRYKEWYRDVAWDADWDYLPEYFKIGGFRRNSGLKYYRITGKEISLDRKEYYRPDWAAQAAAEHAGQFIFHRGVQANEFWQKNKRKPIYLSAYDGELFGHWWEEGPYWLELVFRKMLYDQSTVRPITPTEYLAEQHHHQRLTPGITTWGEGDYFDTWLDTRSYQPNAWVYRHLFRLIDKMTNLAKDKENLSPVEGRALNQATREIMLAQSSDWGFLIKTRQAIRYSEIRLVRHLHWAKQLLQQVQQGAVDQETLTLLEYADNLFPGEVDFRDLARGK